MTIDNNWYNELHNHWWDPGGPVGALHQMNPARFTYFRGVLGSLSGLAVLDVGCGGGILAESFTRAGAIVFGLDRSFSSLQAAHEHLRQSQSEWINGSGDQLLWSLLRTGRVGEFRIGDSKLISYIGYGVKSAT